LGVTPEIRTATRTIEKLRGKSTLSAKIGDVRGKLQITGWRMNVLAENLNCRAKVQIFSGSSKALPEH
jgi:hypothetical protein